MNLGEIIKYSKKIVPGIARAGFDDDDVTFFANEGARNIAQMSICLKKNKKFNIVAEQSEYLLSTITPDFLAMDEPGIFWNSGTEASTSYKPLDPQTRELRDREIEKWRDSPSADPQRYFKVENTIDIHPKASASLTGGGWIYYGRKPDKMTGNAHFPFHVENAQNIEITELSILCWSIFDFMEVQFAKIISKDDNEVYVRNQVFEKNLKDRMNFIKQRVDIRKDTQMRGPRI